MATSKTMLSPFLSLILAASTVNCAPEPGIRGLFSQNILANGDFKDSDKELPHWDVNELAADTTISQQVNAKNGKKYAVTFYVKKVMGNDCTPQSWEAALGTIEFTGCDHMAYFGQEMIGNNNWKKNVYRCTTPLSYKESPRLNITSIGECGGSIISKVKMQRV